MGLQHELWTCRQAFEKAKLDICALSFIYDSANTKRKQNKWKQGILNMYFTFKIQNNPKMNTYRDSYFLLLWDI